MSNKFLRNLVLVTSIATGLSTFTPVTNVVFAGTGIHVDELNPDFNSLEAHDFTNEKFIFLDDSITPRQKSIIVKVINKINSYGVITLALRDDATKVTTGDMVITTDAKNQARLPGLKANGLCQHIGFAKLTIADHSDKQFASTTMHEIGHALGLKHAENDRSTVMCSLGSVEATQLEYSRAEINQIASQHTNKIMYPDVELYAEEPYEPGEIKIDKLNKIEVFNTLQTAQVFTLQGKTMKKVPGKKLEKNTEWATDQVVVISTETFYRVATNEWLKVADGEVK